MASVASVAFIKGIPSAVAAHKSAPKPGSTLRRIFDALHERSGLPTRLDGVSKVRSAIENLRTSYGLDIRAIRHGGAGGTQWVLAGEWFGTRYVDYVAQRLEGPVAKKNRPRRNFSNGALWSDWEWTIERVRADLAIGDRGAID